MCVCVYVCVCVCVCVCVERGVGEGGLSVLFGNPTLAINFHSGKNIFGEVTLYLKQNTTGSM